MSPRGAKSCCLAGLGVALLAVLGACAGDGPKLGPMQGTLAVPPTSKEPYRIQPGDELEIRFFHTPEQNVTLPVRPDGFISLPLVHELEVAGRTVEEVRQDLVQRCSQELAEPEIAVIVRTFTGYLVHVGGEVNSPGVLELKGPRTVLEAVFEAGGFLSSASPKDVLVVRRHEDGTYELMDSDLSRVLKGESSRGNFTLQPFDVVYVPTSPIADVNKWVDLYLRKNLPFNVGFTYRLNPDNGN